MVSRATATVFWIATAVRCAAGADTSLALKDDLAREEHGPGEFSAYLDAHRFGLVHDIGAQTHAYAAGIPTAGPSPT
jgi:hypothetical protein